MGRLREHQNAIHRLPLRRPQCLIHRADCLPQQVHPLRPSTPQVSNPHGNLALRRNLLRAPPRHTQTLAPLRTHPPTRPTSPAFERLFRGIPRPQQPQSRAQSRGILPVVKDPHHTERGVHQLPAVPEDDSKGAIPGRPGDLCGCGIGERAVFQGKCVGNRYCLCGVYDDGVLSDLDWKEDGGSEGRRTAIAAESECHCGGAVDPGIDVGGCVSRLFINIHDDAPNSRGRRLRCESAEPVPIPDHREDIRIDIQHRLQCEDDRHPLARLVHRRQDFHFARHRGRAAGIGWCLAICRLGQEVKAMLFCTIDYSCYRHIRYPDFRPMDPIRVLSYLANSRTDHRNQANRSESIHPPATSRPPAIFQNLNPLPQHKGYNRIPPLPPESIPNNASTNP